MQKKIGKIAAGVGLGMAIGGIGGAVSSAMMHGGSAMKPMYISELHPWGTVKGAGDKRYRKETILILR